MEKKIMACMMMLAVTSGVSLAAGLKIENPNCGATIELQQSAGPVQKFEVPLGKSVCWQAAETQHIVLADGNRFVIDVLERDINGVPVVAGVRGGQSGYSTMVNINDAKDGHRATFFVHTSRLTK